LACQAELADTIDRPRRKNLLPQEPKPWQLAEEHLSSIVYR
jgi:hypothetical protein